MSSEANCTSNPAKHLEKEDLFFNEWSGFLAKIKKYWIRKEAVQLNVKKTLTTSLMAATLCFFVVWLRLAQEALNSINNFKKQKMTALSIY